MAGPLSGAEAVRLVRFAREAEAVLLAAQQTAREYGDLVDHAIARARLAGETVLRAQAVYDEAMAACAAAAARLPILVE